MVGAFIRIMDMFNFVSICEQSFQRNVIEVCVFARHRRAHAAVYCYFPGIAKISIFNRGDPFVVRLSLSAMEGIGVFSTGKTRCLLWAHRIWLVYKERNWSLQPDKLCCVHTDALFCLRC